MKLINDIHDQHSALLYQKSEMPSEFSGTSDSFVRLFKPVDPVHIFWPDRLVSKAKEFLHGFPGQTMYAVKTNADPRVIKVLYETGITRFDVASIQEVKLVYDVAPQAKIYFMHPVKSREAIRQAYYTYGVRAFVLDCEEELYKILHETDSATDLELFIRLALPKSDQTVLSLSSKFGATMDQATFLLKKCRAVCHSLGVSFHVGWQCTNTGAFRMALEKASEAVKNAHVTLDAIDVGGGFPSPFSNMSIPPLGDYFSEIRSALTQNGFTNIQVLCEPGQGLTSLSGALIARIELRRGNVLYLNDGIYGGLHDASDHVGMKYPVRPIRAKGEFKDKMIPFQLAGPTCDSLDILHGVYHLPDDINEGDWIEFGLTGSYSEVLRTKFNGFDTVSKVSLI